MYYSESIIPQLILNSEHNTIDPTNADFFLVEHFSTCLYNECITTKNAEMCKRESEIHLEKTLNNLQFLETQPQKHLFIFSWDQASEVIGFYSQLHQKLIKTIHLTHLGSKTKLYNFDPLKDIVIPPYQDYTMLDIIGEKPKKIFLHFRGTVLDDRAYSKGIRQDLMKINEPRYLISNETSSMYWDEISMSLFGACAPGWVSWTQRCFDYIYSGAIPVFFDSNMLFPFESVVEFGVLLSSVDDIHKLHTLDYEPLKARLDELKYVFSYSCDSKGAFYHIIKELEKKLKERENDFL